MVKKSTRNLSLPRIQQHLCNKSKRNWAHNLIFAETQLDICLTKLVEKWNSSSTWQKLNMYITKIKETALKLDLPETQVGISQHQMQRTKHQLLPPQEASEAGSEGASGSSSQDSMLSSKGAAAAAGGSSHHDRTLPNVLTRIRNILDNRGSVSG